MGTWNLSEKIPFAFVRRLRDILTPSYYSIRLPIHLPSLSSSLLPREDSPLTKLYCYTANLHTNHIFYKLIMSSSASSLRPAWKGGGKGFQPPPTVASERSKKDEPRRDTNAFAALDDEEEAAAVAAAMSEKGGSNNMRSEGLRGSGAATAASAASRHSGRSLAELAATANPSAGRFERLRSDSNVSEGKVEQKVVRYTRERLLSMRPAALLQPPEALSDLIGSAIVAEEGQDPVCWDTFSADEIWATQPRRQAAVVKAAPGLTQDEGALKRVPGGRRENTGGAGRWERGVALPPPDQAKKREKDASNAEELWDDPVSGGAATDFSSFGVASDEPFDFEKMAEASKELERELHGDRKRADSDASGTLENHMAKVHPARPLASIGTTIRSGSGDDVNVFEDFDVPDESLGVDSGATNENIKAGIADPSASSRLMEMIGVKRDVSSGLNVGGAPAVEEKLASPWGSASQTNADAAAVSLNPWGTSLMPRGQGDAKGIDMKVLSELEEQKRRTDELRRRHEEESQRRMAQQQSEERERQTSMQQQQQAGVQSQVEIVLLERITAILENSWGRSDLVSILTTLHSEDSRVIPLLSSVDALRALILRNPRRISMRHDPAFGSEMAILVMTNVQWQQHQQQEALAHQQEEEERRQRDEMEMMQKRTAAANAMPPLLVDAPWYYSDPQRNIQGPFKAQEMRQWLEAGYFKGDLPISQQQSGPFRPLQAIFPNLDAAFYISDNAQSEGNVRGGAEENAHIRAQEIAGREREMKEASEKAEIEAARKKEEDVAAKANGGNDSSSQLKMMLGLSTTGTGKVQQSETVSSPAASDKKSKSGKQNTTAQQQRAKQVAAEKEALAGGAAPAPAWGSAPAAKAHAKTLAEIQQEEARKNAILAMQQQKTGSSTGGWANVAAARGGSTAWQSGTVKPTTAAVLTNPSAAVQMPSGSTRDKPTSSGSASSSLHSQTIPHQGSNSSAAEEFGAKMSPALEKWCNDQMMKLNGTNDLTLVSFCMTLCNASEIRQYLTAYLGSTPQVNSFATEFINKRGLGAPVQEEWETTAQVKKTRKKKGGR